MSTNFITIKETAERLHASRSFVYRLVHAKKLTVYKMGRLTRFDPGEVDKLMVSCKSRRLGRAPQKKIAEISAAEKAG